MSELFNKYGTLPRQNIAVCRKCGKQYYPIDAWYAKHGNYCPECVGVDPEEDLKDVLPMLYPAKYGITFVPPKTE